MFDMFFWGASSLSPDKRIIRWNWLDMFHSCFSRRFHRLQRGWDKPKFHQEATSVGRGTPKIITAEAERVGLVGCPSKISKMIPMWTPKMPVKTPAKAQVTLGRFLGNLTHVELFWPAIVCRIAIVFSISLHCLTCLFLCHFCMLMFHPFPSYLRWSERPQ